MNQAKLAALAPATRATLEEHVRPSWVRLVIAGLGDSVLVATLTHAYIARPKSAGAVEVRRWDLARFKVHSELGTGNRWLTLETDQDGAKPVVKGSAAGLQPNGLALLPGGNRFIQLGQIRELGTWPRRRGRQRQHRQRCRPEAWMLRPSRRGRSAAVCSSQLTTRAKLTWAAAGVAFLVMFCPARGQRLLPLA